MAEPRLPFDWAPDQAGARLDALDRDSRAQAVDPRLNVALEASAGTGKTKVLVDRYVNLLRAGVDPSEILALTFTRKAAAEMRERIVATLRTAAGRGEIPPARWRQLRDRTADVSISTIDAFCLSLLREFPLEADLDPGFSMADDTEVPRLIDEALDRALRVCRSVARDDEHVALVFAQLGDRRARRGLAALLGRRIIAPAVLSRYVAASRQLSVRDAAARGRATLCQVLRAMRGGVDRFLETGPLDPSFALLAQSIRELEGADEVDPVGVQSAFARARAHFLTQDGTPRSRLLSQYRKDTFASPTDWRVHRDLVVGHAPAVLDADRAFRHDLNALVARGVLRMFRIAETEYRRTLDARAVLDFPDVLLKSLELLRQMEEFSQSRFRLESRYHHVLVDEFQDTSRAQWELVSLLIEAWGEGAGLAHTGALAPSVFIVGDRKQSIYAFRDADVGLLREAARHLGTLRPGGDVRRSISRSYRSAAPLLAFINGVCHDLPKAADRRDAFLYEEHDRFPIETPADPAGVAALSLLVGDTSESCAQTAAAEIARLIADGALVRDRETGVRRPVQAGDVAVLFRTRESHREFERALEALGIPAYVYKGLGFFDADEIKDVLALLWYLAEPASDLRAAAWLRSRFVRLSDEALRRLGPRIADALRTGGVATALDADDAEALAAARDAAIRWRGRADRLPPAELLDLVLEESAYAVELRGPRRQQARENLKKIRAIVRRIQNRGYATVDRVAAHLDRLALGEEANAVIDATGAVSLMTVHASKGLEFPVVFLVNLSKGTGGRRDPIRIAVDPANQEVSVAVGDFEAAADEDGEARELEETKRLLYVALTRARDRLYLGSVLKEGRFQPARGSLGAVLPTSLQALFDEAATGATDLSWSASEGGTHRLHVCAAAAPVDVSGVNRTDSARVFPSDYDTLEDDTPRRVSAAESPEGVSPALVRAREGRESDRLVGTLVHRLVQREGLSATGDPARLRRAAFALLAASPIPDVDDPADLVTEAVDVFRALVDRPDIRSLHEVGEAFHEVPFSLKVDDRVVRGTIDCLVRQSGERVTVLEFKTGRRRVEHRAQTEVYRQAAQALFPGTTVEARLVYPEEPEGP
jgi:ATP-dependent helicase/nuclease subunit A